MAESAGRKKGKSRLIPEGELTCIWMDAGVVAYKLCNYRYECESCPFDAEMRFSGQAPLASAPARPSRSEAQEERMTPKVVEEFCYHPGHTWVRPKAGRSRGGRVQVGMDNFAAQILPRVNDVILPHRGNTIRQGHVFFWIVCGSNTLPIVAPITGTVVVANSKLRVQPTLINADPHGEGWLLSVEPSDVERELAELLKGEYAAFWMAREWRKFERLASLLQWPADLLSAPRDDTEVGTTLADGGEWLVGVEDDVRLRRYLEFIVQFFI